jgi:ABC-type sugar transport system ATPase subunit
MKFIRGGTTMIYVTHDQVEAMTLADKMVVMNGGVIQQCGPPLALYDDPDNLFVAGFIGSTSPPSPSAAQRCRCLPPRAQSGCGTAAR